jgi:hypothetical protein
MRVKRVSMLAAVAAATLLAGLAGPASVVAAPGDGAAKAVGKSKYSSNIYIVRLDGLPVVAYDGRIKGYAATKPRKGQKIDPDSAKVVRYADYLTAGHDAALAQVGGKRGLQLRLQLRRIRGRIHRRPGPEGVAGLTVVAVDTD